MRIIYINVLTYALDLSVGLEHGWILGNVSAGHWGTGLCETTGSSRSATLDDHTFSFSNNFHDVL